MDKKEKNIKQTSKTRNQKNINQTQNSQTTPQIPNHRESINSLYFSKQYDVIEEEISSKSRSSNEEEMKHFKEDEFLFNQKTIKSKKNSSIDDQNHSNQKVRKDSARSNRDKV